MVSAVDLVHAIAKEEPNVDITHIGEANLVVTLRESKASTKWYSWFKDIIGLCADIFLEVLFLL